MASGLIGNEVLRKELRVRVPCPPLPGLKKQEFCLPHPLSNPNCRRDSLFWSLKVGARQGNTAILVGDLPLHSQLS